MRVGEARYSIRDGDVIACPPGGPGVAHQIINTSQTAELKYLAVSTRLSPDIAEYPDTGKFAVLASSLPALDGKPEMFRFIGRAQASLDDWEGE